MKLRAIAEDILKQELSIEQLEAEKIVQNLNMTNPDFKSLTSSFGKHVLEIVDKSIKGEDFTALEDEKDAILEKINDILAPHGINYDVIIYGDQSEQVIKNISDKKSIVGQKFQEILDELIEEELQKGITAIADFKDVKLTETQKNKKKEYAALYSTLLQFFNDFPNNKIPNIIITGSVGTGKTYAVTVLKNALIKYKDADVLFLRAQEMLDKFREIHTQYSTSLDDPFSVFLNPEVLIIDDLGSESKFANITEPYLYHLLTMRIQYNKPTIITSNETLKSIEDKYGMRNYSRLFSNLTSICVNIVAEDIRTD